MEKVIKTQQPLAWPTVPEFARVAPQGVDTLHYAGAPRQYRFDGEVGAFFVGSRQFDQISAQIFARRFVYEQRWGRPMQTWLDLAFVDQDSTVSVLALKKESAVNLHELFVNLDQMGADWKAVEVLLTAAVRTVRHGEDDLESYHVCDWEEWEFSSESRYQSVKAIEQFDWVLSGEAASSQTEVR
ncbi:MAG: hypothetical protein AAF609_22840 [Cyanobacteria bacterium P01_C01_bin.120]